MVKKLIFVLLAAMLLTACGQTKENHREGIYMNITAEEAKNRAISAVANSELADIEKLIIEASERGEFSIKVPEFELSTPTVNALEKLGYKADYKEEYCLNVTKYYWDISW